MKKSFNGFTLIELIIAITLIRIITMWFNYINFNPQVDKQKFLSFSNEIYSNIETVRNNSLIWRWIWTDLIHPTQTIININTANSWSININYYSWTTSSLSNSWISLIPFSSISKLNCKNITENQSWTITNIDLIINWSNLSLSWCTWSFSWAILDITAKYKNLEKIIRINTVTSLIEKIDN